MKKIIETAPGNKFTASLNEGAFAELDPTTVHWKSSDSNIVGVTTNPDKRTATIDVNVRGTAIVKIVGNTLDGETFSGSLAFFSGLDAGELDIELGDYVEYVEPSTQSVGESLLEDMQAASDNEQLDGQANALPPPVVETTSGVFTSPDDPYEATDGGTQRDGISLTGVDNKEDPNNPPATPPADPAVTV